MSAENTEQGAEGRGPGNGGSYRLTMRALSAFDEVVRGEMLAADKRASNVSLTAMLLLLHLAVVVDEELPEEQCYMGYLADICGVCTAAATQLVDRYEAIGLVERYGSAAHDRRVMRARLTRRGLELMRGVKAKLEGRAWKEL